MILEEDQRLIYKIVVFLYTIHYKLNIFYSTNCLNTFVKELWEVTRSRYHQQVDHFFANGVERFFCELK